MVLTVDLFEPLVAAYIMLCRVAATLAVINETTEVLREKNCV